MPLARMAAEGQLAYFLSDLVDSFPLRAMEEEPEDALRGAPPYDPVMRVKVLLCPYCTRCTAPGRSPPFAGHPNSFAGCPFRVDSGRNAVRHGVGVSVGM